MHALPFFCGMDKLIEYLSACLTPDRLKRFDEVLDQRTRYVTVALEDIYQPQNASAVLRTCDCLGIQDIHIIENKNSYRTDPEVAMGSAKWLDIYTYAHADHPVQLAIDQLKQSGYRILATTPHDSKQLLEDVDLEKGKIALFFGTELTGLSQTLLDQADEYVQISMYGFTESYNLSVSAALCLYELTGRLRRSALPWPLTREEKQLIKLHWLKNNIKQADLLIKRFHESL